MKKKIILSYDYELFFGEISGTVQKTLIEPTNYLLSAMDKYNQKGNFFVDWLMLKYLKKEKTERTVSDYNLIEKQLQDIVRRGHRIELHIHPHWVDAKYNGDGTWDFSDFHHYSLYSFSKQEITQMFVEGVDTLTAIARKVDPDYKIIAFRAGGWTVQPFEILMEGFKMSDIKIDSSVSLGSYNKTPFFEYDFRNVSTRCSYYYRFHDDVAKEVENGEYLEVPISSYHRDFINRVLDKMLKVFTNYSDVITDGTHQRNDLPQKTRSSIMMVTMSRMNPLSVLRGISMNKGELITLIDHPKDFTISNLATLKILSKFYKSITYKDLL